MNESIDPELTIEAPSAPLDALTTKPISDSVSTNVHSAAETPAGELLAVPGYRVVREISRGGMGRVLAAHDLVLDRDVALKILLPGAPADRFVRESKITARLPHPGIPPVHALGTLADGSPFLAMKLIAGQTLSAECKTADRPRLLQVFTQVCQAVGFAHSRGVIHRDLKPSNVMVGAFGEVQVMDWGLAKDLKDEERRIQQEENQDATDPSTPVILDPSSLLMTQAGQVMGTPAYMAPEQARAEAVDARADVFGLGGILCAILTGKPPFSGKSSAEALQRAADADLAEAHARLDGCGADAEIVALCRRCLSPSPADRPNDGQAVANAMTAYLSGVQDRLRAAEIAGAQANERARSERRTRRLQLIAASLLLLVLAGGIVGTSVGLVQARRAQQKAEFAEGEEKKRADELQKVSGYQAQMLQQVDPAKAGIQLMADLRARHAAALIKGNLTESEKQARSAAFERELHAVNGNDAAVALLDQTVLAPAVQAIDTEFTDQPLVDASLRMTLGGVYHKLGRPEKALALYQRAHVERAALLGKADRLTLASQANIGEAQGELQQLVEGERTLREVLEALRSQGEDDKDACETMRLLALNLDHQGKYAESEALYRDVLERSRVVLGLDNELTLHIMKDMGGCLLERGKLSEAEALLREAVEGQRRTEDRFLGHTMTNLGVALHRQHKYAAAEPFTREALERHRQEAGEDHPITITDISNLAALCMDLGKLPEAEALAKEALTKCRRIHGNEHAHTLKATNVMGQVLSKQGKLKETETYYREALETGRRVLGEDHPDTIIFTFNLGALLRQMRRYAEAEPYMRTAREKNRKVMGETHPYTLTMTRNLGDLLRDLGKPAEAEVYLREALEKLKGLNGADHPETLSLMGSLGAVLRDEGKLTDAETYFQQSLEGYRRRFGEEHGSTITAMLRMASLRVAQGKYFDALALLTPVDGKVAKAIPGPVGVLRQASLTGLIGKARAGLAKEPSEFARAESDLLEAHRIFVKNRGENDKETREWTQGLADLYAAWDKAEPGKGYAAKAAEWNERLSTPPKR